MATINTFMVVAHFPGATSDVRTFEVKALERVPLASVEHIARMATADKGLAFDTLFPVVSL